MGFVRRGFPFPVADGIHRGLRQHWMPSFNLYRLYRSVGRDQRIHLYYALQSHTPSQGRISRSGALDNSPRSLLRPHLMER